MQTKEMKKDYEVAVLDPAGNVTAIVLSDVPAAERARAAARLLRLPELHIEQVAFLTAPRCGGEIRLEMMGGEFCGNALRCAGFYHALRTGVQGKTCVFAEISGAEGVQPVMADTAAGEASTVMPLPRAVQPVEWPDVPAVRVTFDGITHFVIDRAQPDDALVQRAIAAAPEASREWGFYIIPDLKTWATNAEQQTPIGRPAACGRSFLCARPAPALRRRAAPPAVLRLPWCSRRTLPTASRRSASASRAARWRSACSAPMAR